MKRQQQQQDPAANLSILSYLSLDLIVRILDHLPDSTDRKSFRLVCRAFSRAESLHRRSLTLLRPEFLAPLLARYSSLETLDFSLCPPFNYDLALASSNIASLKRIDLSRAGGVGWRGLEAVVAACPRLEAVDLSHCVGFGDREAAAIAGAKGLRELKMDKCLRVTDVGLANVAVGCGRLETLGLKWCLEVSDIGIDLLVKKCRDIRVLDLSYLKVTNQSLRSISSLEKLEVLSMVGCSNIDNEGLGYLNNGRNSLKSIDVSRCDNVTSAGLTSVIDGHKFIQKLNIGDCFPDLAPLFLSKLSVVTVSLKTLQLDGFQVSAASLKIISLNCKNLVEISLSKCRGVTDQGICELVSNCVDLLTIDLTCCGLISDKALSAISTNCKKLQCLWLESCSLVTEHGLDQIATSCTGLKKIDLTDCTVNDAALKCLSRCSCLIVLKLGLCSSITDEGVAYIGLNCRNLKELDLYRCAGVSDGALASIATGCKQLMKLNLCYCTEITDQGLKHLSALKELRDLELRGLHNITSLGIIAIAIGCSSLAELDLKHCQAVDDVAMCALAQYSRNIRQINISYCSVSRLGLWTLLGNLCCLQDLDVVNLTRMSVEGFELGLRATCGRLKKLKLVKGLRYLLSPGLLRMLQTRGCRLRWVDKPLILVPVMSGADEKLRSM